VTHSAAGPLGTSVVSVSYTMTPFVVAERGDQVGPHQHLHERRHEGAVCLGALDAAGGRVADDVRGDEGHRPVEVLAGPGAVVFKRDGELLGHHVPPG